QHVGVEVDVFSWCWVVGDVGLPGDSVEVLTVGFGRLKRRRVFVGQTWQSTGENSAGVSVKNSVHHGPEVRKIQVVVDGRSEERRVGKEGRLQKRVEA